MSLEDLHLKGSYSSSKDRLLKDFYNPVLACAKQYDRIAGYFSPKVFAIASRGFGGLLDNNGHIRIITSVKVDTETYAAITKVDEYKLAGKLVDDFDLDSLHSDLDRSYLQLFMRLYATGQLELKVAVTADNVGILHEKVGIIKDDDGKAISFSGSNNETASGWIYNTEEFKVFNNWQVSTVTYYKTDESKFERYWNNQEKGLRIITLDEARKMQLVSKVNKDLSIEAIKKKITELEQSDDNEVRPIELPTDPRKLFDYQKEAIEHWFSHGNASVFEMATGTGKTFTTISALRQFKKTYKYLHAIVVVPLITLTEQWSKDLKKLILETDIVNTSLDRNWKKTVNDITNGRKLGTDIDYVVVTTYDMFASGIFDNTILDVDKDVVLIADEMHNMVNERRIEAIKNPAYKYKLGLSATPTRLWRPEESKIVANIFGNNSFTYDLEQAINNNFLVPYYYRPIPVTLTGEEYEEYVSLSRDIGRMSAYKNKDRNKKDVSLNMKLMRRARIKKNAENKLLALENIVVKLQNDDKLYNALIYSDNEKYLTAIQQMLTSHNIRTTRFIGENTTEERNAAINTLRDKSINAIVAIKCLDEGVDIPSAQSAFFVSNNTDPRECVQRLGRVLRIDREGDKKYANIYDYIVVPPKEVHFRDPGERNISRNMIKNELIRAKFFEKLALNSDEISDEIADAVDVYGFNFKDSELQYNQGNEE